MARKLIHTPEGVRDIFGIECDRKRYLERQIEKLLRSYGYQSIETPTCEYLTVFDKEVGTTPSRELYQFFDREGDTIVLRPDFTPSVARAASMYFSEESMPLRFCYRGNVFINYSGLQGRLRESTQMGVEYLNDDSPEADAEILSLVIAIMQRSGLQDFQITVGNVNFFRALTEEAEMDEEDILELREMLSIQNRFGAQALIEKLRLRKDLAEAFLRLPELFGDYTVLEQAEKLAPNVRAREAVLRMKKIHALLQVYGMDRYVTFDLGMVSAFRYYTGIIFQAYTYGSGEALIKGGRYDDLLRHFGKNAPAIGFVTQVDALLTALERRHIAIPVEDIKTMLLYAPEMEDYAIRFAAEERRRGIDTACIRFAEGKVLDDYRAYGQRNQFGGILYFRSEEEGYAIDLHTGETTRLEMPDFEGGAAE